jgi:hypothetical protein
MRYMQKSINNSPLIITVYVKTSGHIKKLGRLGIKVNFAIKQ